MIRRIRIYKKRGLFLDLLWVVTGAARLGLVTSDGRLCIVGSDNVGGTIPYAEQTVKRCSQRLRATKLQGWITSCRASNEKGPERKQLGLERGTVSVHNRCLAKSGFRCGWNRTRFPKMGMLSSPMVYSCHSGHHRATLSFFLLSLGWRARNEHK